VRAAVLLSASIFSPAAQTVCVVHDVSWCPVALWYVLASQPTQDPSAVVLMVEIFCPAAQVVCAVQLVPSNQYPLLQDAHLAVLCVGQSAPVAPDPFEQVHSFKLH
tara:strand:+ start:214 stop:531 length:318 start_codon:yes stop_codon:yes gene_type:complete